VKLLDLDKPLNALGHADLLAIAHYWFTLPGNVGSRRTVKNYFSGLRAFLNWCESQDAYGFTKPKESAKILSVKGADEPNVTPADYVSLAAVMKGAPVRTRMYAMLGVLCGFGQMDICKLGFSEVQVIDGETFITGYRAKEDSEAKRGKKIKTTHWIPASVAAVMQAERAEPNEWGYYFLNRSGRPMFAEKIDGGKYDAVTKAWEGATADHDNAPTFKQLRKWGWNEIPKHADLSVDKVCVGEMLAKRWAGQQGGGVAAAYRFSDYRPVIAAQRAWWAEIEAKVWQEREASRKE
jgi:integrase